MSKSAERGAAELVYQAFNHAKRDVSFHMVSRDPDKNTVYLEANKSAFEVTVREVPPRPTA